MHVLCHGLTRCRNVSRSVRLRQDRSPIGRLGPSKRSRHTLNLSAWTKPWGREGKQPSEWQYLKKGMNSAQKPRALSPRSCPNEQTTPARFALERDAGYPPRSAGRRVRVLLAGIPCAFPEGPAGPPSCPQGSVDDFNPVFSLRREHHRRGYALSLQTDRAGRSEQTDGQEDR